MLKGLEMNVNELNQAEVKGLKLVAISALNEDLIENDDEIIDPFEDKEASFVERERLPVAEYGQSMMMSMHILNGQMRQLKDDFARLRFLLDEMDESSLN